MAVSLLSTKLYVPTVRAGLVARPRLINELEVGIQLGRKLTLVSASAGFGKTTLLSEWIARDRLPVAWLSLDEWDNDAAHFLDYFVAALQTIEAKAGEEARNAIRSVDPLAVEPVLTPLINDMTAISKPFVLVLDNYDLITAQSIHDILSFLLDHQPLPLHLVIASRIDPPLPISRLRVRGQVTEIRAADLRFTEEETTVFLNEHMNLGLSPEDISLLSVNTEGWVAGLQLAALAMQGHEDRRGFIASFTGRNHYLTDYLMDEVMRRQTENVRDFLRQTSVLRRLCAPLCDAVIRVHNSQQILYDLDRANLFLVPLDEERCWYRYHHLFATFLRQRLHETQLGQIPELHRRASEWYEQNGYVSEAIVHARAADDVERVVRLVREHTLPTILRGDVSAARRWMDSLPDEVVRSQPRLATNYAWALFLGGQMSAMETHLQDAEASLAESVTPTGDGQAAGISGEIAALRSFLLRMDDQPTRGIELAQQAFEQIPEDNLFVRGVLYYSLGGLLNDVGDLAGASRSYSEAIPLCQAAGNVAGALLATHHRARLLMTQGQLHRASAVCCQVLDATGETGVQGERPPPALGMVHVTMGSVLYEWNQLASAEAHLREGIELGKVGGYRYPVFLGHIVLASVLRARGDRDDATDALAKAVESASGISDWWCAVEQTACQVQLWLAQGNVAAAVRWARRSGLGADDELCYRHEVEHTALARIWIAQGRMEPQGPHLHHAARLLGRLCRAAESAGRMGHVIELLCLQALALQARGDLDQAIAWLRRALELAEPAGYVRTFVDEDAPMAHLLQEAVRRTIAPDYVNGLLAAFEQNACDQDPPSLPPLVEPLTEREIEILQSISHALSNREIAEELYLSLNTIKWYTGRIYGKLGVDNRAAAVERARELSLL
jgi:LuxR family maltose regulon positive regulatory protein